MVSLRIVVKAPDPPVGQPGASNHRAGSRMGARRKRKTSLTEQEVGRDHEHHFKLYRRKHQKNSI